MEIVIFFLVSFISSTAGAICGIGGGVIIKPVLDFLGMGSVSAISFLSGCTVLSMSCYSVIASDRTKVRGTHIRTDTYLALGAAAGGIVGKIVFSMILAALNYSERVGAIQAMVLALITAGTIAYTLNKKNIRTKKVGNPAACTGIGLSLGLMSSFLGIGGGPVNLVVLYYFFSMDTKKAAGSSLYIIMISQITSLLVTVITGTIPEFYAGWLIVMVAGGIIGGIAGGILNRRMNENMVDRLFIILLAVIILICISNFARFI